MSDENSKDPSFSYVDLSHAVIGEEIGVSWIQDAVVTGSAEGTLFALSVRGDCICGKPSVREPVIMLTATAAIGVVAQLTRRLLQSGMDPQELDDRLVAENVCLGETDHPELGRLVDGCPTCGRAQPECTCNHVWAARS